MGIRRAPGWVFLTYAASAPAALAAYMGYTQRIERRAATELSLQAARTHAAFGTALGVSLFCATLGTVAVTKGAGMAAIGSVGISLSSAVSEELVFRELLGAAGSSRYILALSASRPHLNRGSAVQCARSCMAAPRF